MKKLKTVFLGNPAFSLPTLEALLKSELVELIGVCGSPDKPVGEVRKFKAPQLLILQKKTTLKFFKVIA